MPKQSIDKTAARREELLHGCVACFAAKGFHQTSMRDLCEALQISAGGLYTYFSSKEEIIMAVIERDRSAVQQMFASLPQGMPFFDGLGLLDAGADQIPDGPGSQAGRAVWAQIAAEASINPAVRKQVAKHYEFMTSLIEREIKAAQERGEVRPDADPHGLAMVILSTCDGLIMRQSFNPKLKRASYMACLVSALRSALEVKPVAAKKGGRAV